MRLPDKIAVITGAGSGFGAAMAERFSQEGATVVCVDLNGDSAKATADRISGAGGRAFAAQCDVSDGDSVRAMVDAVVQEAGPFEVLINNAAVTQKPSRIAKIRETELDRMFAVNVKSLYHMSCHALPVLRKRGGGSVINIASVAAMRPRPGMTWYNASKAAVIVVTQSMAAELAPDKIRVNAIAPAVGRTPMFDAMFGDDATAAQDRLAEALPLGRLCEPSDIASAAVFLTSDEANYITGVVLPVDGGRLVG